MMCSGTASLPMSCSSAAARRASCSSAVEAQFFGELRGVDLHALQMIVRGVILGFDRQRQRFNGAQMQRRKPLRRASFSFSRRARYRR